MESGRALVPYLLVAIRVFMGFFFLYEAEHQLAGGWVGGDGLERMLRSALDSNSMPAPYRRFLEDIVIPNDHLFTVLVIPGEIAVGIALVLGIATRFTALVALSMNANFLVMNGFVTGGALFDALFIVLELMLIALPARQAVSVDRVLAAREIASWWMSGAVTPAQAVSRLAPSSG